MRRWIWIALTTACGPMYQQPGGPPPRSPPAQQSGAPGGSETITAEDPSDPRGPLPDDPYAGGAPADPYAPAAPVRLGHGDPGDGPEDPYEAPAVEPAAARRGAPRGEAAIWIDAHNKLRAKHCAGALGWSAKLAEAAQRWANALRDRSCSFGHSNGSYGENLAAGTSGTLDPVQVVQMWYDEVSEYRFPDGGFSAKTGHFTQVVWRGTKQVGCGRSQCKGLDIFVCEYDPPGNWEGQYRDNVRPRGCR